jgi:predicted transcriptional regulator
MSNLTTQQHIKNRNRLDLIAAILKVVNAKEGSKTRIMYTAYLSYPQIKEYMPILLENGLLTTTNEQQSHYKIRERGMRFLELYHQVDEMIAE